ncbi:MAG: ABC transporter ATP-binding protein [Candidatus Atribacteria bacterium]|nr:ABC transporter ATP-binding protein [Candidatus Atribacteria bacterium]
MVLLELKGVTKTFGGLTAVDSVDMTIEEGQIVGLIGPNGAGKTTLFNCIVGYYCPNAGEIWYDGTRIDGMAPHEVCKRKLVRTFQVVKILNKLTVLENVMVGAFLNNKNVSVARKKAREVLDFCGLSTLADEKGSDLTIVDKKRVEAARSIATDPKLILFDEVMSGLNPKEGQEAIQLVYKIRELGITILMVEHVMEIIMPISDRIIVLELGKKIMEGTAVEVAKNEKVINAYLGVKPQCY